MPRKNDSTPPVANLPRPRLFVARVVDHLLLCREHYRLVVRSPAIGAARPGQFLHIGPHGAEVSAGETPTPLLRRAFSIAGLRPVDTATCDMDVIYRVVGSCTRWLQSLNPGDDISVIGPCGGAFPIDKAKTHAWMVAGGVGLPPMLWLAEALHAAGRDGVALIGARTADLLPLTIDNPSSLSTGATLASAAAAEFARHGTPVVISTDDGSLGYRGHAAAAMASLLDASSIAPADLVVYTCGPEPMMRAVAEYCLARSISCFVCMERSMACATGTCQSCVVSVRDPRAADGWRYALCCTEGPVFDAANIIWKDPGACGGPA